MEMVLQKFINIFQRGSFCALLLFLYWNFKIHFWGSPTAVLSSNANVVPKKKISFNHGRAKPNFSFQSFHWSLKFSLNTLKNFPEKIFWNSFKERLSVLCIHARYQLNYLTLRSDILKEASFGEILQENNSLHEEIFYEKRFFGSFKAQKLLLKINEIEIKFNWTIFLPE